MNSNRKAKKKTSNPHVRILTSKPSCMTFSIKRYLSKHIESIIRKPGVLSVVQMTNDSFSMDSLEEHSDAHSIAYKLL